MIEQKINQPPAPFTCTHSPNVPELLWQMNCTLAISTYQAGKVVFISATNSDYLIQLPRNFKKAMGMAIQNHQVAVATKDEVIVLGNSSALAPNYGPQPKTYDGLFLPRATYYIGEIDIHDMAWGERGLYAVNTRFSCLSLINDKFSFEPVWHPPFISDLVPHDKCHLNGMVMVDGKPKYVTALGTTDSEKGWRDKIENGGVLMDVDSNEIILEGLPMPHTPRMFDDKLYVLLSATGELASVDLNRGKYDVIAKLDGFLRGMAKYGDYLFIGLSRLRKNASTFRDLPIAKKSLYCGIAIIHLPTGAQVGHIKYETSVEELYDIQIIPNMKRPGILNTEKDEYKRALVTPTDSYWSAPNND